MPTYQPGDICWSVAEGEGAVLVTAFRESTVLGPGRTLEVYEGCSFHPDSAPESVERFAIVVTSPEIRQSWSPSADL